MTAVFRLLCLVFALIALPALAEQRIALVVGNSNYGRVSPLDNPENDARLIGAALEKQGFEVQLLIDASQGDMKRGISEFGRSLRVAGSDAVGLFYYAGHGVQSFGTNYLLPVDVNVNDAADLDLVAVEAQSVLRQMYSARNRTNIIILDACRNNPFSEIPEFNDNGLAEMQAPTGTFLAYATAPGSVALDGVGNNSPFTDALVRQMSVPGVHIEQVFKNVRVEVIEKTGGQQTPWDASSLTNDFMFAKEVQQTPVEREADQLWASIQESRDPLQIVLFLRGFADSVHANDARALLAEVIAEDLKQNAPAQPAATAQGPSETERMMFEAARAEASPSGYKAFLESYPGSVFSEFARQELAALDGRGGTDPVGPGAPSGPTVTATAPAPDTGEPKGPITYTTPLASEEPLVAGRTIAELISASPLYPPIEGLPDSYWKGQSCSNCHEWTQARICDQANVYLSLNMQRSLDKQHPFGGALKRNLKVWAAGGCQ